LERIGVPPSKLHDATLYIAFSIASTLDNCAGMMQPDDSPLIPVLTFDVSKANYTKLVARSGGTYMHEYIGETVHELFRNASS
jgi:hypothetical protein